MEKKLKSCFLSEPSYSGPSPGSQGSKSNYSRTGPAKKPAQKAAPPPPEPKGE